MIPTPAFGLLAGIALVVVGQNETDSLPKRIGFLLFGTALVEWGFIGTIAALVVPPVHHLLRSAFR